MQLMCGYFFKNMDVHVPVPVTKPTGTLQLKTITASAALGRALDIDGAQVKCRNILCIFEISSHYFHIICISYFALFLTAPCHNASGELYKAEYIVIV